MPSFHAPSVPSLDRSPGTLARVSGRDPLASSLSGPLHHCPESCSHLPATVFELPPRIVRFDSGLQVNTRPPRDCVEQSPEIFTCSSPSHERTLPTFPSTGCKGPGRGPHRNKPCPDRQDHHRDWQGGLPAWNRRVKSTRKGNPPTVWNSSAQERAEMAYEHVSKAGPDLAGTNGIMETVQKRVADGAQVVHAAQPQAILQAATLLPEVLH